MIDEKDEKLIISNNQIADLAIEFWRLQQWSNIIINEKQLAPLRHYYRKMVQFLSDCNVELIDLVGREYDAGMAVDIVDSISVETDVCKTIIIETISPLVMLNGQVIRHGKVVIQVPSIKNYIKGDE